MGKWNVGAIEQAFADAAVDSSRWNSAMDIVSDITGAVGAALFPVVGRIPFLPQSERPAACFESHVRYGWIYRDERHEGLPAFFGNRVATDFATPEQINRHPNYQEFLAPHKLDGLPAFSWPPAMINGRCQFSALNPRATIHRE